MLDQVAKKSKDLLKNAEAVSLRFFCKKTCFLQFTEKDNPTQVFSYEFFEVFKNTYFVDHV